jgi:hypothetical protein
MLLNKNFAVSKLSEYISAVQTYFELDSVENFPKVGEGRFRAIIWGAEYPSPDQDDEREIVEAQRKDGGNEFNVVDRGQENTKETTSAKEWNAGSNVAISLTAGKMNEIEELIQDGTLSYGEADGTSDYIMSLTPELTTYKEGFGLKTKFKSTSTGSVTLKINELDAKKIYASKGDNFEQLGPGDIFAGMLGGLIYDKALDTGKGGWNLISYTKSLVALFGDQIITGTKTFTEIPVIPVESPINDTQVTSKKYVDNQTFPSGIRILIGNTAEIPKGWEKLAEWNGTHSIMLANSFQIENETGGTDDPILYNTAISVSPHEIHSHQLASHAHAVYSGGWTHDGNSPAAGNLAVHKDNTLLNTLNKASANKNTSFGGTESTSVDGPTTHTVVQDSYTPRYQLMIMIRKK